MSLGTATAILYLASWFTGWAAAKSDNIIGYIIFCLIGVAAFFWVRQEVGA